MSPGLYDVKRVVRAPLVAVRRRRARDEPESARTFLELQGYSRAARDLMLAKAIDPHILHRADLDADSVVVDVGSYAGDGAAQIHGLYGCRVYGFEPNPTPFAMLEARFAEVPEVVTLPYGLGARDQTLSLELAGPGSSLHGTIDGSGEGSTVEVQVRDAVAAFAELGLDQIDMMKVNIEGAEYDLLEHLLAAGKVPSIRYLLVQFHEWHPGAHRRRRSIRRALGRTHELVWDHPWIFELWCDRSRPHPPPPPVDDALRAAIVAEVQARQAGQAGREQG